MVYEDNNLPADAEIFTLSRTKEHKYEMIDVTLAQIGEMISSTDLEPQLNQSRTAYENGDEAQGMNIIYTHFPRVCWSIRSNDKSQLTGYVALNVICHKPQQIASLRNQLASRPQTLAAMANSRGDGLIWVVWTGLTEAADFDNHVEICETVVSNFTFDIPADIKIGMTGLTSFYRLVPDSSAYLNPSPRKAPLTDRQYAVDSIADRPLPASQAKVDVPTLSANATSAPAELAKAKSSTREEPPVHQPGPNLSKEATTHTGEPLNKRLNDLRRLMPIAEEMIRPPETDREPVPSQNHSSEMEREEKRLDTSNDPKGILRAATMNQWLTEASTKPVPKMLCDEFWFEGELCILFAATNQGKSVKAVQIGERIATGKSDKGFRVETEPQRVIYFDFELSAKQVEKRYSESYKNHYQFSPNFIRVEIDPNEIVPANVSFSEYILAAIKQTIDQAGARVVIIDNVTFLTANSEASKDAGPFIIGLQQLKKQLSLSMLIIGHTPKTDPSRPITLNDLQGSSRLGQLIDSMFAIGASTKDPSIKYFKQLKARAVPYRYESDNVIVCQLHQPGNFLRFDFLEYGHEQDHLKAIGEDERKSTQTQVLALSAEGKTQTQIAQELGISQSKVSRILHRNAPAPGPPSSPI